MYENNAATSQSEYILIYVLSSSSPLDSYDSWLVDNGSSRNFYGYWEVLSKLVERKTNLKISLGGKHYSSCEGFWFYQISCALVNLFFIMMCCMF